VTVEPTPEAFEIHTFSMVLQVTGPRPVAVIVEPAIDTPRPRASKFTQSFFLALPTISRLAAARGSTLIVSFSEPPVKFSRFARAPPLGRVPLPSPSRVALSAES